MNNRQTIVSFLDKEIKKNQLLYHAILNHHVSIKAYLNKLNQAATIEDYESNGVLSGVVCYYCNDPERINGFITLLIVAENEQKKGIATKLLIKAINCMKQRSFEYCILEVNVNNYKAIAFYKKNGFSIFKSNDIYHTMRIALK